MNAQTAQTRIAREWNAAAAAADAGEITPAEYELICHELNDRRHRLLTSLAR